MLEQGSKDTCRVLVVVVLVGLSVCECVWVCLCATGYEMEAKRQSREKRSAYSMERLHFRSSINRKMLWHAQRLHVLFPFHQPTPSKHVFTRQWLLDMAERIPTAASYIIIRHKMDGNFAKCKKHYTYSSKGVKVCIPLGPGWKRKVILFHNLSKRPS